MNRRIKKAAGEIRQVATVGALLLAVVLFACIAPAIIYWVSGPDRRGKRA